MVETKRRSVLKALSWRVVAWSITVGIAYLFTGKAAFALAIGVADSVLKIFAYYLHVGYGREPRAAFGVAPADDGRELAGVP